MGQICHTRTANRRPHHLPGREVRIDRALRGTASRPRVKSSSPQPWHGHRVLQEASPASTYDGKANIAADAAHEPPAQGSDAPCEDVTR